MQCPVCHVALAMSDRNGIEIDYCPQCRGVWLDRGELDKLIERSSATRSNQEHDSRPQQEYRDHDDNYRHSDQPHHKKHKKEGFLGDLFDF
jgi:uncharacterized protein